jgi:hypothetical protein
MDLSFMRHHQEKQYLKNTFIPWPQKCNITFPHLQSIMSRFRELWHCHYRVALLYLL